MTAEKYLSMQRRQYENDAASWSLSNRNPVVGSYDAHNHWSDYETVLFKDIHTEGKVALEYGCGPGRNLIRFKDRFTRIDGVDIAQTNLDKARINLDHHDVTSSVLMLCDGRSIPTPNERYDVVFSVICLQHIACHEVRYSIFKDAYRVLKQGGYLCFQMGFGGRTSSYPTAEYHDNAYDAQGTNSAHDVTVRDPKQLQEDLERIGFTDFTYDLRATGPGDCHTNWIWVQARK